MANKEIHDIAVVRDALPDDEVEVQGAAGGESVRVPASTLGSGASPAGNNGDVQIKDGTTFTGLPVIGFAALINTDGDPGRTIFVGSIDPVVDNTPVDGDVWIEQ